MSELQYGVIPDLAQRVAQRLKPPKETVTVTGLRQKKSLRRLLGGLEFLLHDQVGGKQRLLHLEEELSKRVVGQQSGIEA